MPCPYLCAPIPGTAVSCGAFPRNHNFEYSHPSADHHCHLPLSNALSGGGPSSAASRALGESFEVPAQSTFSSTLLSESSHSAAPPKPTHVLALGSAVDLFRVLPHAMDVFLAVIQIIKQR